MIWTDAIQTIILVIGSFVLSIMGVFIEVKTAFSAVYLRYMNHAPILRMFILISTKLSHTFCRFSTYRGV